MCCRGFWFKCGSGKGERFNTEYAEERRRAQRKQRRVGDAAGIMASWGAASSAPTEYFCDCGCERWRSEDRRCEGDVKGEEHRRDRLCHEKRGARTGCATKVEDARLEKSIS
jgi:hypothetical protein